MLISKTIKDQQNNLVKRLKQYGTVYRLKINDIEKRIVVLETEKIKKLFENQHFYSFGRYLNVGFIERKQLEIILKKIEKDIVLPSNNIRLPQAGVEDEEILKFLVSKIDPAGDSVGIWTDALLPSSLDGDIVFTRNDLVVLVAD